MSSRSYSSALLACSITAPDMTRHCDGRSSQFMSSVKWLPSEMGCCSLERSRRCHLGNAIAGAWRDGARRQVGEVLHTYTPAVGITAGSEGAF